MTEEIYHRHWILLMVLPNAKCRWRGVRYAPDILKYTHTIDAHTDERSHVRSFTHSRTRARMIEIYHHVQKE